MKQNVIDDYNIISGQQKAAILMLSLEGELARTIRSVDNIRSARVHLVLPKREMFSKEEQTPSASVVIKTQKGNLSLQNIQSIQKLVAAAVPKLDVKNVAIVDAAGNLLTNNYEDEETINNANNEVLRLEQERKMAAKVQALLEKSVGAGKAQAQVNIEMDFDQVVTNEEIYDPDSQVVRSQATITEEGNSGQNIKPVTVAQNIPNGDGVTNNSGTYSQNMFVNIAKFIPHSTSGRTADFFHNNGNTIFIQSLSQQTFSTFIRTDKRSGVGNFFGEFCNGNFDAYAAYGFGAKRGFRRLGKNFAQRIYEQLVKIDTPRFA